MKNEGIVRALRRLKVETGSLVCMGCGREHNCDIHGCRIVREAAELIEKLTDRCARYAEEIAVAHGRIVGSLEDGRYRRRFSCCGEDATMITQWAWPKYCPNCGAKMDGGADNA